MKATQLARELQAERFWATQPKAVVVLAARYYAGIDSLEQLRHMAEPAVYGTNRWTGEDKFLRPTLTEDQVQTIIDLR